jgi:hypothetical protein
VVQDALRVEVKVSQADFLHVFLRAVVDVTTGTALAEKLSEKVV